MEVNALLQKIKTQAETVEFDDVIAVIDEHYLYTPDFVDPQGRWIIECKGYANERFPLKWKMFKKLLMERENPPVLFVPRNQKQNIETVQKILEIIAPTS